MSKQSNTERALAVLASGFLFVLFLILALISMSTLRSMSSTLFGLAGFFFLVLVVSVVLFYRGKTR
jgi:hypothetical protein